MVLRDPGKNSIILAKTFYRLDRISCSIALISSKDSFLGEKVTHFFYLHLMHCSCMNESKKMESTHNIFLNPKYLAQISTAIG